MEAVASQHCGKIETFKFRLAKTQSRFVLGLSAPETRDFRSRGSVTSNQRAFPGEMKSGRGSFVGHENCCVFAVVVVSKVENPVGFTCDQCGYVRTGLDEQ